MAVIPTWAREGIGTADQLARAAHAARLAGDHELAREIDAEFDQLYDGLELQAEAARLERTIAQGQETLAELRAARTSVEA